MKWLPDGWQDVGALAGMVALAWNGIAVFYNRHRFKFECTMGYEEGQELSSDEPDGKGLGQISFTPYTSGHLCLRVVNIGPKPGYLAGIQRSSTSQAGERVTHAVFPKRLEPNEAWTWKANLAAVAPDTIALWAEDNDGRQFRISKRRLKALKAEAAAFLKANPIR